MNSTFFYNGFKPRIAIFKLIIRFKDEGKGVSSRFDWVWDFVSTKLRSYNTRIEIISISNLQPVITAILEISNVEVFKFNGQSVFKGKCGLARIRSSVIVGIIRRDYCYSWSSNYIVRGYTIYDVNGSCNSI